MNRFYFIFTSLFLISCEPRSGPKGEVTEGDIKKVVESQASASGSQAQTKPKVFKTIQNRCITHDFRQGQDDSLYGKVCLEGKRLVIKTEKTGEPVSDSRAIPTKATEGFRLEGKLDFVGKFHNVPYKFVKGKGDDKHIEWLGGFLPKDTEFFKGALGTEYQIIFKIMGNYLVLFKASKKLSDIPHTYRTSCLKANNSSDGECFANSGWYMVPFVGYPVRHCKAELEVNEDTGVKGYLSRLVCDNKVTADKAPYIRVLDNSAVPYKYIEKKDLYPASYFEGRWFFSSGVIEGPSREGHLPPSDAFLVEMKKRPGKMEFNDISGNVEERLQNVKYELPVQWLEFEMNYDGSAFTNFAEKVNNKGKNEINRSYLAIDFPKIASASDITGNFCGIKKGAIIDFLVSDDYFSYVVERSISFPENRQIELPNGTTASMPSCDHGNFKKLKFKYSFLREKALDSKGFSPKFLHEKFHNHFYGTMFTAPQKARQEGEYKEKEAFSHVRAIQFNTSLNTEKELKSGEKIIKWHFSKNTAKEKNYRDVARQAVAIFNRAFEIIYKDSPDKKVKVVLAEEEGDKDLGDLRYNIINMVLTKNLSDEGNSAGILLGYAPSYVYPDTGQIIGATANLFVQSIEDQYNKSVRDYIRYEIFQKGKESRSGVPYDIVSPYLRYKIENQCDKTLKFISQAKKDKDIIGNPRKNLNDTSYILSCGKKLAKEALLSTLLHEMGHNFGLSHNFKASVDKKNYYVDGDELKEYFPMAGDIAVNLKSSSVMDYLPYNVPQMQVLGKYDLAALRFAYRSKIETKDGIINLGDVLDPDELVESTSQKYAHCSDFVTLNEDFLCSRFDYGSTPLEIVNYYISNFWSGLNKNYRYDSLNNNDESIFFSSTIFLGKVILFYKKWLGLRDQYRLSHQKHFARYHVGDERDNVIKKYRDFISIRPEDDEEYKSYFLIRKPIVDFMMQVLFQEDMRCKVHREGREGEKPIFLHLNVIIKYMIGLKQKDFYIRDCYSPAIKNFLKSHKFVLEGQIGWENFSSYYHKAEGLDGKQDVNYVPLIIEKILNGLSSEEMGLNWSAWTREPDFFDRYREKIEKEALESNFLGKHRNDFVNISGAFKTFLFQLRANAASDKDLLDNNLSYYRVERFDLGTGPNSFEEKVTRFVEANPKGGIYKSKIPYLISVYSEYLKNHKDFFSDFQDYILSREDILKIKGSREFIVPFKEDSFIAKVIVKYNTNQEKIKNLEKKERLDLAEIQSLESLIPYNQELYKIIFEEERQAKQFRLAQ